MFSKNLLEVENKVKGKALLPDILDLNSNRGRGTLILDWITFQPANGRHFNQLAL